MPGEADKLVSAVGGGGGNVRSGIVVEETGGPRERACSSLEVYEKFINDCIAQNNKKQDTIKYEIERLTAELEKTKVQRGQLEEESVRVERAISVIRGEDEKAAKSSDIYYR